MGDDQGQTVDGNDYIDDLLIQEKYDQGQFSFIVNSNA